MKLYTILQLYNGSLPAVYRQFASTITLPSPLSAKACPQALYIRIMPIGRSYLYILPVAYYLYYTSTLFTYLGTLGVLVY